MSAGDEILADRRAAQDAHHPRAGGSLRLADDLAEAVIDAGGKRGADAIDASDKIQRALRAYESSRGREYPRF